MSKVQIRHYETSLSKVTRLRMRKAEAYILRNGIQKQEWWGFQ